LASALCVFDIDGVLLVNGAPSREGVENVRRCVERGLRVAIVSGRRLEEWPRIRSLLKSSGAPVDRIEILALKRSEEDTREFKLRIYSEIVAEGLDVAEIHEDDLDLVRKLTSMFPRARIYVYSSGRVVEVLDRGSS